MKFIPPKSVLTSEEITLATFRQRAYAFIIDFVFIGLLYLIIKLILLKLDINAMRIDLKGPERIQLNGHLPIEKIYSFFPVIYFTLATYFTNGKTLGKRVLKIRTVSIYHNKISFKNSFERVLGYALSEIEAGFGFLQMFWTTNRMCLHDQLAETIVIQENPKKGQTL